MAKLETSAKVLSSIPQEESCTREVRKVPGGTIIRESSWGKDGYKSSERVEPDRRGVGDESLRGAINALK